MSSGGSSGRSSEDASNRPNSSTPRRSHAFSTSRSGRSSSRALAPTNSGGGGAGGAGMLSSSSSSTKGGELKGYASRRDPDPPLHKSITTSSHPLPPSGGDISSNPTAGATVSSSPPSLYKSRCPMFEMRSDEELDALLEMSLQGHPVGTNPQFISHCEGHPPEWKEFYDHELLTDCIIVANDGKGFPAHRSLLAANCPYFYEKFCTSSSPPTVLTLRTVDSSTLQTILDFIYTGDIFPKSVNSICALLPIAQNFKLTPILQLSSAYLVEQVISPENALQIYTKAAPHFCPTLLAKVKTFILHNFRSVVRTPEFLLLGPDVLKALLKDDELNAKNEAMVFEAVRAWVEFEPRSRRRYIPELLSCVRFGLMSYGYFTNVVLTWDYVREDESVRRALEAPSVLLTSIDSLNNSEVDLNDPLARPRIPTEVIFAVGGWSAGSPTAFIETYDIRADRWFLLNNSDSSPRAYHGLVALGHYIYMIGGFDGQEHFSTVKRFDPVGGVWEEKSCMLFPRCYVSCTALNGIIYACGGYNGRNRMSSAEKYDPELNQWEMIRPMNKSRSDASATSLKGRVYIAGGFTGTEVLNSVEMYDPKEDQWTFIQPMNSARSGVSLVSYRDSLYALGGFNGFNRLNTGERYDPDEPSSWKVIPEMSSARSNFAAVCSDELLICIGGFNGATTIPYVECYDSKINEWFDASHMNLNRSALSACVVANLPNAKEYSYLNRIQELLGIPGEPEEPGTQEGQEDMEF